MDDVAAADEVKIAELRAIVEAIKDRVRAQYPSTSAPLDPEAAVPIHVPIADLMPLVHARDAAQAKMAALGSVNPRAGGIVNSAIQMVKRAVARGLGWFVRDQITFNRGVITCVEATIEALNELNRSVASMAGGVGASLSQNRSAMDARLQSFEGSVAGLPGQVAELRRTLTARELQWAKAIEDLQRAGHERTMAHEKHYGDLLAAQHREWNQTLRAQHAEFQNSLARVGVDLQEKLGARPSRLRNWTLSASSIANCGLCGSGQRVCRLCRCLPPKMGE